MEFQFILFSLYVTLAASVDLGPYIRIAQCRSQCLKNLSTDGICDSYTNTEELVCNECWRHCESLEYQWETYKDFCEFQAVYENCPSCKTICDYRKTRVMEEYLPSTLPAPERPPTSLKKYDIAILLTKVNNEWRESGYYPGSRVTRMRTSMWLIVVSGDGVKHYTYDEWIPTLESLRPGALYEATVSWKNIESQIRKHHMHEQKEFNDRVRQFYLEKYGHKVVHERETEGDSPAAESVFKNFFFQRRNNGDDKILGDNVRPSTSVENSDDDVEDVASKKESWVVVWEPEAGGLMGNQEADSTFAQITLLPGTKYRVRVASKDGPGSFPIEVDTSSTFVQVHRLKKNFENIYTWGIIAASTSMVIFIIVFVIIKFLTTRSKKIVPSEEVEEVV